MADLKDVEIARVGTWQLASGELEVTEQMLRDAADYAGRPDARPAALKIGHTDPRFDGEPALGWLGNLRVEGAGDDSVLKGDVTDMPDWLAEVAPSAWPDRSMEGWTDYEADGRTYGMVVDGLALLGVTPPGMKTLRSLRDLPQALGVAASSRIAAATFLQAAVSNRPWSDFTQADYTDEQWRRACVLHRGGEGKEAHGLPIREPGGALNRNGVHAAAGRFNQVQAPPDAKKSAANALIRAYGELGEEPPEVLRRATASQNPTSAAEAAARIHNAPVRGTPKGATVDLTTEQENTLRAALGIPDGDPLEPDKVLAAIDGLKTQPQEPDEPEEPKEPVAATAPAPQGSGTLTIDASAWDAQQERIKRLEAREAKRDREERDKVIAQAIQDGKFLPNRREHWVRAWDGDPKGTRELIAGLQKNVVSVEAMGYTGDGDDGSIDQEFAHLWPAGAFDGKGA